MRKDAVEINKFAEVLDRRDDIIQDVPFAHISQKDMTEIYKMIVNLDGFGYQPILVIDYPEWVLKEHRSEPQIILQWSMGFTNGLLLIKESETMYDDVRQSIENISKKKIIGYLFDDSQKIAKEFDREISSDLLHYIYEKAIAIAIDLKTTTPCIYIFNKRYTNGNDGLTIHGYDDSEHNNASLIIIKPLGKLFMLFTLAHEMRHAWQHQNHLVEPTKGEYSLPATFMDYLSQWVEIDADAYASLHLNNLRYDGTRYMFSSRSAQNSVAGKEHLKDVMKRMKEIVQESKQIA